MTPRFSDQILEVFDVPPDTYEFLASVLEQRAVAPEDWQLIFAESLVAGVEAWYHEIDHAATVVHGASHQRPSPNAAPGPGAAWSSTDRLIEQAKKLAGEAKELPCTTSNTPLAPTTKRVAQVSKATKRKTTDTASHYWCPNGGDDATEAPSKRPRLAELSCVTIPRLNLPQSPVNLGTVHGASPRFYPVPAAPAPPSTPARAGTSPYFAASTPKTPQSLGKRRLPGTVSCIPFPPLNAASFGIIQEKVAHEPFWLLIAVTFLIKTSGQLAIPTFLRVKERFPTPRDIAEPGNALEILDMVRHLGLAQNRLRFMQKYAQAFLFDPPQAGVRYPVRDYDTRDAGDGEGDGRGSDGGAHGEAHGADSSWEIGHMTQGRYAIDSWRIFCRDALLGRAQNWDGKGREAEFQPEWMRVLPADKELRAYLRWMWMREGWEWDPATGERSVLREEMRRAVNDGRVEYDERGGLRITN